MDTLEARQICECGARLNLNRVCQKCEDRAMRTLTDKINAEAIAMLKRGYMLGHMPEGE